MVIIYNLDGTVDFLATREIVLGNPGEDFFFLEEDDSDTSQEDTHA